MFASWRRILIFCMWISVSSMLNIMTTMTSCFIFFKHTSIPAWFHTARFLPIQILVKKLELSPACNITSRFSTTDVRVHHKTLSLVILTLFTYSQHVSLWYTCILILFAHVLLSLPEDIITNILYAFILLLSWTTCSVHHSLII
jgi:hypothetical protein